MKASGILNRKTLDHIGGENSKITKPSRHCAAHAILSAMTHFGHGAAIEIAIEMTVPALRRLAPIQVEAAMGLMDVLNGMQNGPHGARGAGIGKSGGMSPITMAVLGLLAYKALKSFGGGSNPGPAAAGPNKTVPSGNTASAGGIGDVLKGGLGGLLAGGAAGSILSGGLNDLLRQFQQAGHGGAMNSWVGNGPNKSILPGDLAQVLDSDQVKSLMTQSGLSRDDVLAALSEHLPGLVNELTPNGRLPTEQEASRLLQ